MNTQHWQKLDSLFDEYLDASPAEQANFLARRCENEEIRHELEKLISALNKSSDFIENPVFTPLKKFLDEDETDDLIGSKIHSYKIEKLLGKGGMGTVYLAKRIDDFSKEVALKIIPPFTGSKNNKENFRRERQILAKLNHPNIAQILDGGTTENGLPFLVMEYVEGVPLNEFCQNLSLSEKLDLFQNVCNAVGYAHKNLIVHRDLKPSNILVRADGTVKLLDFGIAKLLQTEDLDLDSKNTFRGNALTPEYASPEQINGENITIASDIYSLGVVLYEILTNTRPHNFKEKSLNEILKIIAKDEPKTPNISKEIDSILFKSLAKNPLERYQSAEEFRQDISNFLNNLPISARPNTYSYRLKKFVNRNLIQVAVSTGILLLLLGWGITIIWQTFQTVSQSRENRRTAYAAEMILAANEFENTNLNRVNELLEKYQPNENDEDLRGFEWHFLKNLLNPSAKIGSLLHSDEVWNIEFSPDGKFLATVSNDNITRIWDVENKNVVAQTAEQKGAWRCSYFPDGKRLAVSSSSNSNPLVTTYKTENGAEILSLKGHTKRVRAVDVSPDGKIIATGSGDGTVRIWSAETGEELRKINFATDEKGTEIQDVQFSKSGEKLAVGGFEIVAVIDTKTWQIKKAKLDDFVEKTKSLSPWKVVFSPLEKTLAVGNFSGEVFLLDSDKLNIIKSLPLHQVTVKGLAFSNDGKILATASWDRIVKFIDVQTGEVVNELKGHFAGIHEVVYSPNGEKLATASADFSVNLWDAQAVVKENSLLTKSSIFTILPESNSLVSWNNGNFELTNWKAIEKQINWSEKADVKAFAIDISNNKNLIVTGGREGLISLFNSLTGESLRQFQPYQKIIYSIKFSADGNRLFALYEDGVFQAIDSTTGEVIFTNQLHSTVSKSLAVSPNGKFIATGSNDKSVKILDAETFKEIYVFTASVKPLYMVVFSTDSSLLASSGADDMVRIWRMSDGKLLQELSGMSGGVFAVTFSPDGKRIATASDIGIIRLWETESGRQVLAFTASKKQIIQLKFIEDGKTLLSIDNEGKVNYWKTK